MNKKRISGKITKPRNPGRVVQKNTQTKPVKEKRSKSAKTGRQFVKSMVPIWNPTKGPFQQKVTEFHKYLGGGRYTYVSGQMTSGQRACGSDNRLPSKPPELFAARMRLNRLEMEFICDVMRCAGETRRVIHPFQLDDKYPPNLKKLEGWSQDDFNTFWAEFISEHVERVILAPGWQYSNGGVWEAYVGCVCSSATTECEEFAQPGIRFTQSILIERLKEGLRYLSNIQGADTVVHRKLLEELDRPVSPQIAA